jgi:ubiquitin carboxyl-terminal hydrolase 4/11/15
LEIIEEFRSAIHHQFTNSEPLVQIQSVDVIYAYELPCRYPPPSDSDWVIFAITNQKQSRFNSAELFGVPSLVAIPREDTYSFDKVYRATVCAAQRYTTADLFKPTEEALDDDDDDDDDNDKKETSQDDAMVTEETLASEDLYNNRCIRPLRGLFRMAVVEDQYNMPSSYRQLSLVCEYSTLQRSCTRDLIDPNATKKESTTIETTSNIIAVTDVSTVNSLATVSPPISDNDDDESDVAIDKENKPTSSITDSDTNDVNEATMMETESVPLVETGNTVILNWADRACSRFLTTTSFYQLQHNLPKPRSVFGDGSELWRVKDQKQVSPVQDSNTQGPLTLSRCLDEFTRAEQLGEDDSWYCPQCKEHRQATKKFDLWRLPDTLVVHLKRFGQSRGWRDKIDDLVEFPIE